MAATDPLTSPGLLLGQRAQVEAQVIAETRAALDEVLSAVRREALGALDSPVLVASGFSPFTLGAVLRTWDRFVERVGGALWRSRDEVGPASSRGTSPAPTGPVYPSPSALPKIPSLGGNQTVAQRLGITDPYMVATLDRIAAMGLPSEIHSSVVQVFTEAAQQRWQRKTIREALLTALSPESGFSQRERDADGGLADHGMSWESIADRMARTESTALFSYQTEVEISRMNYPGKRWVAIRDSRTRPTHVAVNGTSVRVGEAFIVGGYSMQGPGDPAAPASERANCFPAGTAARGVIEGAYRRRYSGEMITVETEGGQLTGTPNHPVLTLTGWHPLGQLTEGDYLIRYEAETQASPGCQDVDDEPLSIDQVFEALAVAGDSVRHRALGVDFHGDGTDSEIEIVGTNGLLWTDGQTSADEFVREFLLPAPNAVSSDLVGASARLTGTHGVLLTPPGSLSGGGVAPALLRRARGGEESVRLGIATGLDPVTEQERAERDAATARLTCQTVLGLTGQVALDPVLRVIRSEGWEGHVYNLSTSTGAFTANGIIVHNCRCILVGLGRASARAAGIR